MKRIITGMALIGLTFSTSLWAHHAAQGIVSDDVWEMIDENLTTVDSPHLDIDFENIMDSMRIGRDSENGSVLVYTYADVDPADVDEVEALMNDILQSPDLGANVPAGVTAATYGKTRSLTWELVEWEDGTYTLVLIESIGFEKTAEKGDLNWDK